MTEKTPIFRHRLEHFALRSAEAVVCRLPSSIAMALGRFIGWLGGSVFRIRRKVVEENLARAFPERSRRWRSRVARGTYRHFGREAITLLRVARLDPDRVPYRFEVEGIGVVRETLASGRGVIVLTAHLGNWEMGAAGLTAFGVRLSAVARRQSNPLFDEYMRRFRDRIGVAVLYQEDATREALRWLRGARSVALVADQNVAHGGIFVDFFGVAASTARGPAVLATRTGALPIFAAALRLPGPGAVYSIRFRAVEGEPGPNDDDGARAILERYTELLEETIRRAPDQYFWFHKRWKTRPEQ